MPSRYCTSRYVGIINGHIGIYFELTAGQSRHSDYVAGNWKYYTTRFRHGQAIWYQSILFLSLNLIHIGATIFGFNVTMPSSLKRVVKECHVDIKTQRIIYKMMDDIVDSVNMLMPSQQV